MPPAVVARFSGWNVRRLMADAGIIRNRLKIEAAIANAKTFRFTGGEIVGEFLLSTGYLPGAHRTTCPVHARVLAERPPFLRAT
jgi:DNA-3-methyladenine glycosylase I